MPKAARLGDRISHTNAYSGLIMGALAGAAIAAVCATGGLAAIAIAAAGGAGLGGVLGEFVGGFSTYDAGSIVRASEDTDTNHVGSARATDDVACNDHGNQKIAEGSKLVHIDGLPAARLGDRTTCGAEISTASDDTNIGGPKEQLLAVDPEVPLAAELIVGALGLIGGVGAVAMAAKGLKLLMAARLAAGLAGGAGFGYEGNKIGGKLFGEGSRGQRQFALGSGLFGGALSSGAAGGRLDPFNYRVKVDPNALGMNGGNARLEYAGRPPDFLQPARASLRGQVYEMPGVENERFTYTKRSPADARTLRDAFDGGVRRDYVKDLGTNRADDLRAQGVTEDEITALKSGGVPRGMAVHHIHPLDDGGTNDPDNLVLIRNEPDHKLLTNYQNATVGDLQPGQSRVVDWPTPPRDAAIWPPLGGGARPVPPEGP